MATQMSKKRKREDVELPDEILFEILSWLPAKSVCISKCCSKSFLHFTNSSNFAIKQSQNSLLKGDSYFFIQKDLINDEIRKTKIHSSLPREKMGVPYKFFRYVDKNSVRILASSNGLLLCQTRQRQLFICNPITQSHSFIPSPFTHGFDKRLYPKIIFSFECNNNDEDYKLYALHEDYFQSPHNSTLVCKMYIPKQGVWKERETRLILGFEYSIRYQLSVFYKGAIYFIIVDSEWRRHLASYNVESGVWRVIELPDEAVGKHAQDVGIFKWGEVGSKKESICWVKLNRNPKVGNSFTVWVLSDHESSSIGGWSKISNVSLMELGFEIGCTFSSVLGFTMMNGGSLIFATKTEVYDYDLSGKRETRLEKVCDYNRFRQRYSTVTLLPYSDTLRSCGIGSTILRI